MEKYNICLSNCWLIERVETIDKEIKKDKNSIVLSFAEYECFQGKINRIFDPFPVKNSYIEKCSQIDKFSKEVIFNVFSLESKGWVQIDSFKSDFIYALKYIQREFKFSLE